MPTPAQNRAKAKYRRTHQDTISITLPKGEREIWKARADDLGLGLAEYVRAMVRHDLDAQGSTLYTPADDVVY